jgi:hypothetical protein
MRLSKEMHAVGTTIAIIGCLAKKASNEALRKGMCGLAYRMGFESNIPGKLLQYQYN